MSVSALETLRPLVVAELKTIIAGATPALGISVYRNTVSNVYEEVSVKFRGPNSLTFINDLRTDTEFKPDGENKDVWEILYPFILYADISADMSTGEISNLIIAQESLTQDIMKCLSAVYLKYINSSTLRWNLYDSIKRSGIYPFEGTTNQVWLGMSGVIRVRYSNGSF
jgi:hypothetical protein